MNANLDAQIIISGLEAYNTKNVDIKDNYDDNFLSFYEEILLEADRIQKEPVIAPDKRKTVKKKQDKKKIVLVGAILSDNDEELLRNAYVKVLGREPDKTGFENNLNKIKSEKNFDRERLIYNFWKSEEGQKRNLEVIGFHKVYMDELLSHEGTDFVEHCFLQILGRKPNPEDKQGYYSFVYREGNSKEEAIKKIKESSEGKSREVDIVGFEKAYKKRKQKEKILSKPVIGNLVLTMYNIIHLNKRLADINADIAGAKMLYEKRFDEVKSEFEEAERELKEAREIIKSLEGRLDESNATILEQKSEIEKLLSEIRNIKNLDMNNDYFERLNEILSGRMTVWGSRDKLSISPRASVYTCFFNTNSGYITIGDYTFAGSNVSVLAGSHDKNLKGLARRDANITEGCDIVIGNGVWLGSNSTILGPATIGDNAVIAAGALVKPGTIVPPNTVYGGVPAIQIGTELTFDGDYSESILKALARKKGILFTEGWSEKKVFSYKGQNIYGYFLMDSEGKVLLESDDYILKYSINGDELTSLIIDDEREKKEFVLNEKEGEINFTLKSPSDDLGCGYISVLAKSLKQGEIAVKIERQIS